MTSWSEDRDALRLFIRLCAALCLTTRADRITAGSKMRNLSATVVLMEAPARYLRTRKSAAWNRGFDLRVRREAAEKAQLDLLNLYVV